VTEHDGATAPQVPTGGGGHPPSPSVARPAPVVSGAESGRESPPAPARAPAAVPKHGGRGTPSRPAQREGDASPGTPVPGLAPTSRPASEGIDGRARDEEAGVRTERASLPPAIEPEGATQRQVNGAPSGTTAKSRQEARDAWRKALSDLHAAQRRDRGKWPAKRPGDAYKPGSARRMPPQPPGGNA
jgi:hypothetical protein